MCAFIILYIRNKTRIFFFIIWQLKSWLYKRCERARHIVLMDVRFVFKNKMFCGFIFYCVCIFFLIYLLVFWGVTKRMWTVSKYAVILFWDEKIWSNPNRRRQSVLYIWDVNLAVPVPGKITYRNDGSGTTHHDIGGNQWNNSALFDMIKEAGKAGVPFSFSYAGGRRGGGSGAVLSVPLSPRPPDLGW